MRLHACILALCVLLHQARAASINVPEKKLDDLDNVDLDTDTDLEQPSVLDLDNNLRKNAVDIPVKVVEESNVKLDENSNDYIPSENDNTNIKRLEIDLQNPGLPQRQEHETQNPESYGDKEKAIFAIRQSMDETQNIFNEGLKSVSNSFKTLFAENEDLPAIQQNIQNLRQTFTSQIEKLNTTIRSYLNPNPNLEVVESGLRNLENNFKSGVDTLTEGVEVLSILREEDEAAREEAVAEQAASPASEAPASQSPAVPAASSPAPNPSQITQPVLNFIQGFQQGILNAFTNINNAVQNTLSGNSQPSSSQSPVSDVIPAPPAPTPAPWSPGALFQQVQNSFQNLINPQQNQQQNQPQPASPGPITQAIQNIVQFIRPGQNNAQQTQQPAPAANPNKGSQNAVPEASNVAPANPDPANPAPVNPAPAAAEPVKAQPVQPAVSSAGPIQQLVQNNPIIKGIQSAVQRIQNPSADTPRNEEIKDDQIDNNVETKGHGGVVAWGNFVSGLVGSIGAVINGTTGNISTAVNSAINTLGTNIQVLERVRHAFNVPNKLASTRHNQCVASCGDNKYSGRVGVLPESEGIQQGVIPAKNEKEIAEKVAEENVPSISDKTD
ncbi:urbain precursor [Danaus plexippus plexippus]|uniref:Urbain n=1 Tax=Danaus plexippus plexippus TaxID=278856 RepID=A0A212FKQ2_DANPL|nr:urbain precursor [Danaus plexippus plexippus]